MRTSRGNKVLAFTAVILVTFIVIWVMEGFIWAVFAIGAAIIFVIIVVAASQNSTERRTYHYDDYNDRHYDRDDAEYIEESEWVPCRTCRGSGTLTKRYPAISGRPSETYNCPDCHGSRGKRRTSRRRVR